MSFIHSIQSMLPRPENRSREDIARDLEDEFAFHLDMKARAIESEEGVDREAACGLAREQFGDIERIRNECQRIALKERIMLQRVNFIMMAVVTLLVIGVGVQVMITQRYNTLALQAITADLANMKFEAATESRDATGGLTNSTRESATDGDYAGLPDNELTGLWSQVDAHGHVIEDGATLELIGRADMRNTSTWPKGLIKMPDKAAIGINLLAGAPPNLQTRMGGIVQGNGRWSYRDGRLSINLGLREWPDILEFQFQKQAVGGGSGDTRVQARVLVEGDIAEVGWHPIDMERGTTIQSLLAQLNVRDDQWITYRRSGADRATAAMPVDRYLEQFASTVLRPNDELAVRDDVPMTTRRSYFLGAWRADVPSIRELRATTTKGQHWQVLLSNQRSRISTLKLEGEDTTWWLGFAADGVSISAYDEINGRQQKVADWDVVDGNLVIDFSNLRDNENLGVRAAGSDNGSSLSAMPALHGQVVFKPVESVADGSRAQAVGDFVVRLFALADPNDPNLDQTIRKFLDAEEKSVDVNYADDPATAAMIKELIAARRKIFDADAGFRAAATAEEKTRAVTEFLTDMLANAKPQAHSQVAIEEVLQQASLKADDLAADNPELAATLRERIAEAKKNIEASAPAAAHNSATDPMSEEELQDFVPKLMTASIPNSAESHLPTLAELDRCAAGIELAYARDPTLLNKLRSMIATVRERVESTALPDSPATAPDESGG